MDIEPPSELFTTTLVHSKELLSPTICRILLEPIESATYRAGQYINLRRPDGLTRSYSLASLPAEDYFLEIQVARKPGGEMSNWLFDTLQPGEGIAVQKADGDSFYQEGATSQPMLMISTSTGLSPLYGILRDALHHGHQGEIHLYQGGRTSDRFYLHDILRKLEQQYPNFYYYECLSSHAVSGQFGTPEGVYAGRADDIAFSRHADLRGWQVYLAGLAEMVDKGQVRAMEHGAAPDAVHCDAFELRLRIEDPQIVPGNDRSYPPPDPVLWEALNSGETLSAVLLDFYTRVFQDENLSSFFHGVTKQRSIEKQYLFMRQIITGEKIYFGDRPRNSHHWMVISDDLFDYRAEIMVSCLREHGLSEPMIHRFREIEEFFRSDIVKSAPYPRLMGDVEIPFEGFGEITLDVGTLCDACEREVTIGEKVIYHMRLGKIYCSDCSAQHHHEVT
jgi:ferredoxin-NADP reductase/truncated hemoglobin YjbI